jgi:hypothetical protein
MYTKPPSPVPLTSKDVLWCVGTTSGACDGNVNPGVVLDQNGTAQCEPSFVGTATVLAGTGSSAMGMPDSGSQLKVYGVAHITCP